jgi:hypothetical protein
MRLKFLCLISTLFIAFQLFAQTLSPFIQNIAGGIGDSSNNRFIFSVGEMSSISNLNLTNSQSIGTGFINSIVSQKRNTPKIITNPTNRTICSRDSTNYVVNASSSSDVRYQWQINIGNGFINIVDSVNYRGITSNQLKIISADTLWDTYKYRCVVTNSIGSVNSDSAYLFVKKRLKINNNIGVQKICVGSSTKFMNGSKGTNSQWRSSNENFASIDVNGVVVGIAAGASTITFQITDTSGCVVESSSTINVDSLPKISKIDGPNIVCQFSSIVLRNATNGGKWTSSNASYASIDSSGNVTGISAGRSIISYQITDINGCKSIDTLPVLVNAQPKISLFAKDTLICKGANFELNANIGVPAKYNWTSIPSGFKSTNSSVSLANPALYKLNITLNNGCVYYDSINVRNTNDSAIVSKILLSSQAYLDENVIAVNITNPVPQNIIWSYPTNAKLVSINDTNLILKFLNVGNYKISLETKSFGVCRSKDSANIIISDRDSSLNNKNIVLVREVNIGPNPSTGVFNFEIYLNIPGKISLRIYSFSGTNIYNKIFNEEEGVTKIIKQVDLSGYPQDTYIAIIQTSDGYEIRKLMKI